MSQRSDEELKAMNPQQLADYISELTSSLSNAKAMVSAAREKQTAEAREALEKKLQDTLKFPVLSQEVMIALKAAGATGFRVVYDIGQPNEVGPGTGTPYPIYGAAARAKAVKVAGEEGALTKATDERRDIIADYDALVSETDKAEDSGKLESRMAAAQERGTLVGTLTSGKTHNATRYDIYTRRLKKMEVAGY